MKELEVNVPRTIGILRDAFDYFLNNIPNEKYEYFLIFDLKNISINFLIWPSLYRLVSRTVSQLIMRLHKPTVEYKLAQLHRIY